MRGNSRLVGPWVAKFSLVGLVCFCVLLVPIGGFAQTACPQGVTAGSVSCLPDQLPSPPPRPAGEWIKTWGALAVNNQRDIGFSSGKISKEDAENVAVSQCERWGIGGCHAETFFFNQCIAVVRASDNSGAMATAATKNKAVSLAKGKCKRDTGQSCEITLAECSLPIFEFYK